MSPNLSLSALLFGSGALLSLALTAAQVRLNSILRLTASPREDRWHKAPTATSGGIAIFCASAALYFAFCRGERNALAVVAVAMWAFGLVDDLVRLRPGVKLAGQSLLCACAVAAGITFHAFSSPVLNAAISFFWLLSVTNAFNLIDNMDGLCSGVTVLIGSSLFYRYTAAGDWSDANLCLIVCAAFAGFLMLNRNPARIFMGDCGSMLAGFTLAALAMTLPLPPATNPAGGLLSVLAAFSYPIFDTLLVSILRKSAGRPISAGGRDHSSHRLVRAGLSEPRAVIVLWILTAVGCCISLAINRGLTALVAWTCGLYAALAVLGIFLAGTRVGAASSEESAASDGSGHADTSESRRRTTAVR